MALRNKELRGESSGELERMDYLKLHKRYILHATHLSTKGYILHATHLSTKGYTALRILNRCHHCSPCEFVLEIRFSSIGLGTCSEIYKLEAYVSHVRMS